MGPEMSVRNHHVIRNNLEEGSFHLPRGRGLKSYKASSQFFAELSLLAARSIQCHQTLCCLFYVTHTVYILTINASTNVRT